MKKPRKSTRPLRSFEPLENRNLLAAHGLGDLNDEFRIRVRNLTPVESGVFFTNEAQLWKTDSASEESELVAESISHPQFPSIDMQALGDKLLFTGSDDAHGTELWVSDGTADGTQLVKDISPGPSGALEGYDVRETFLTVGNEVYFRAHSGGSSLWKTDGTAEGTVRVFQSSKLISNAPMYQLNEEVFFLVGSRGNQSLWKTDGTENGTVKLQENATFIEAATSQFVYFIAERAGADEPSLWRTDGTEAGTVELKENAPRAQGTANGDLYIFSPSKSSEIWQSDGTVAGTKLVRDVGGEKPIEIITATNGLVFIGTNRVEFLPNQSNQAAIFGTPTATELASYDPANDVLTELIDKWYYDGTQVTTVGNTVVVEHGDLWQSDGSIEGTSVLASGIDPRVTAQGKQFFGENGLWASDGIPNTARQLEVDTGATLDSMLRVPHDFFALPISQFQEIGDSVVFVADNSLWVTDGTENGTSLVKSWDAYSRFLTQPFRGHAIISVSENTPNAVGFIEEGPSEVWISDGTIAGTTLLTTRDDVLQTAGQTHDSIIFRGNGFSHLDANLNLHELEMTVQSAMAGRISNQYIVASQDEECVEDSCEYYLTISTVDDQGTAEQIARIGPGPSGQTIQFAPTGGSLAFVANTAEQGPEIWLTDGTAEGTRLAFETLSGPDSKISSQQFETQLYSFDDRIVFQVEGPEFWITNAAADAASSIASGWERLPSSFGTAIWNVGDGFAFVATDESHGSELWLNDGQGLSRVVDIYPGEPSSNVDMLGTAVNGKLFFAADDGQNGREIWLTDGTVVGTQLLKDILPGGASSAPRLNGVTHIFESIPIYIAGLLPTLPQKLNEVFFAAATEEGGLELWKSDATTEGTVQVTDVFAGPDSSSPHSVTLIGDKIFFAAKDNRGYEPWVYETENSQRAGDANGDGDVSFADFLILSGNFGKVDQAFEDGDFDDDGSVTFADFLILSANFRRT